MTDPDPPAWRVDPTVKAIVTGLVLLILGGMIAFQRLRKSHGLPPPAVAKDPLLTAGRSVFLDRCVSCHGSTGRGDGPIAKGLAGPPVGDLTDATWKHGDRPEQVEAVVRDGVKDTAMPGWGKVFGPDDLRAVTAYVYYLARRDVPKSLRKP